MDLAGNVGKVKSRMVEAARRAGRDPGGVTLVAVTKTVGSDVLASLAGLGIRDVGENRVLDALEKSAEGPAGLRWHLIGHLQTNKVKKAVRLFRTVHSVDSVRLAEALSKEAEAQGVDLEVFAEVNSGEEQKSGMSAAEIPGFLDEVAGLPRLRWIGLMTMAPFSDDAENSRPCFRVLREMRDRVRGRHPSVTSLSMGMTQDFEVAIEEGATHVRVGRALFA